MNKKGITLIEIFAIIVIGLILIFALIPVIYNKTHEKEIIAGEQAKYCNTVCEDSYYTINNNYCYCNNGQKYKINMK